MVASTDETVWFIRKEIIQELLDRKVDFSNNTMGWGWDLVSRDLLWMFTGLTTIT